MSDQRSALDRNGKLIDSYADYRFDNNSLIPILYVTLQLSPEDVVKVADVGVAGFGISVAYTVPEVIGSSVYERSNADVYSFGIIMWEMCYGKRAFFDEEDLDAFEVAKGKRPLHVEDNKKPPIGWQHLMEQCWNGNAETRPTASMCHNELTVLYREAVTSF